LYLLNFIVSATSNQAQQRKYGPIPYITTCDIAFAVWMEKRCFYSIFPKMHTNLRKFIKNYTIVFLTEKFPSIFQGASCIFPFFSAFFFLFTRKDQYLKLLGLIALNLVVLATYSTDLHQINLEVR
jgi:hypothetical protein